MKIVEVVVEPFEISAVAPAFRWRDGLPGSEPSHVGAILRIRSDDGHDGIAISNRGVIIGDLVDRRIRDELLGANPFHRELLWHRMWELDRIEEFPIYALGIVDIALWDLAGKALGVPTYELLGAFRTEIPAYASTSTFASDEEYLDVVDQCISLGYRAIKLHAWGDTRRDARLAHAVRNRVGPDRDLMYDGSAGFDLADAVYLGRALSEAGYKWYEEPIREFSVTSYRWLSERVSVPLLVAETSDGAHMNAGDFVISGAATYVRTGVTHKGGLTGALRIAHTADAFRLRVEVAGGGLPNRHLCMAIPNTTYYESLVTSNPVRQDAAVDGNGLVHATTQPGMGYPDDLVAN